MGIIKKTETREYDLDNGFSIHKVTVAKKMEVHTHKFIELVYTLSGKAVHNIDGKEYHVSGGDMLIINYHCRHAITKVDDLRYVDIMLKPEYVNDALKGTEDLFLLLNLRDFSDLSNNVIKDNLLLHFDQEEQEKIEFLLSWTQQEQADRASANNLIMYSALSMILSLVFRKMTENQSTRPALNEHLLSFMARNCGGRLQINEIAAKCGYTTEHFSRRFKAYAGRSPMEYINECRVNKAKGLLCGTNKSIETILYECGFSNRTAFFKKFSKYTGVTPLQYRKNQK